MEFSIKNTVVGQEVTIDNEYYSNTITLCIISDNLNIPEFSKDIEVVCNQSMNGYEVDAEREKKVKEFIDKLNGVS